MGDSYLYREIQDDYNSFARVNAVRVFAKVNAIPFSLKAAFTFSIHLRRKMKTAGFSAAPVEVMRHRFSVSIRLFSQIPFVFH